MIQNVNSYLKKDPGESHWKKPINLHSDNRPYFYLQWSNHLTVKTTYFRSNTIISNSINGKYCQISVPRSSRFTKWTNVYSDRSPSCHFNNSLLLAEKYPILPFFYQPYQMKFLSSNNLKLDGISHSANKQWASDLWNHKRHIQGFLFQHFQHT